jgi:hypothetical protein
MPETTIGRMAEAVRDQYKEVRPGGMGIETAPGVMHTLWDKARAILLALGVHVLVLALLLASTWERPVKNPNEVAMGSVIQATLADMPQPSAATSETRAGQFHAVAPADQHAPIPPPPPSEQKPVGAQPLQPATKPDAMTQSDDNHIIDPHAQPEKSEEADARSNLSQVAGSAPRMIQEDETHPRLTSTQGSEAPDPLEAMRRERAEQEHQRQLEAENASSMQDQHGSPIPEGGSRTSVEPLHPGGVSRNRRKFRHPKFNPAMIASRWEPSVGLSNQLCN